MPRRARRCSRSPPTTGGEYFYAAQSSDLQDLLDLGSQVNWAEERTEVTALVSALGTALVIVAGLFSLRWMQALP